MKEIRVYLPTVQQDCVPVNPGDFATAHFTTVDLMGHWYGGVTETEGHGTWVDGVGVEHREKVFILSSYATPEAEVEYHDRLVNMAISLKGYLNQECMLVSIKEVESVLFL